MWNTWAKCWSESQFSFACHIFILMCCTLGVVIWNQSLRLTGEVSVGLVVVHDYIIYMMSHWILLDTITNTFVHLYMYHISYHITCYTNISFIVELRYIKNFSNKFVLLTLMRRFGMTSLCDTTLHRSKAIVPRISFVWDNAFIVSKLPNDM